MHRYCASSDDVIFDRAPVDYIAYSQYTANKGSSDINDAFVDSMISAVRESLDRLDILAFVPKSQEWPVQMQADGIRPIDHEYRDEVDAIFKQIYREGRFGVMPQKIRRTLLNCLARGKCGWISCSKRLMKCNPASDACNEIRRIGWLSCSSGAVRFAKPTYIDESNSAKRARTKSFTNFVSIAQSTGI